MSATILIHCVVCGKAVFKKPCQLKAGSKFCSIACYRHESPIERFNRLVDKNGPITRPELGPCWLWLGAKDKDGYGKFSTVKVRDGRAHRFSYETHHGPLNGLFCCHKCDTPSCVNPDHLFAGTHTENMRDSSRKGRGKLGERNGRAVLSESDVVAIREALASGKRGMVSKLSRLYGVTTTTISGIRMGRLWGHLVE